MTAAVVEAAVVAEGRGADVQNRFGSVRIVPEHLGPLDPAVDLLDQRFRRRTGDRQTRFVVLRVVHPFAVVGDVTHRVDQRFHGVIVGRFLRRVSAALPTGLRQFLDHVIDAPLPVEPHVKRPLLSLAGEFSTQSRSGWFQHTVMRRAQKHALLVRSPKTGGFQRGRNSAPEQFNELRPNTVRHGSCWVVCWC